MAVLSYQHYLNSYCFSRMRIFDIYKDKHPCLCYVEEFCVTNCCSHYTSFCCVFSV